MRGIHHPEPFDIGEIELGDPLLRLPQHRRGNIDAAQPTIAGIEQQRDSVPTDFKNASANAPGGGHGSLSAAFEYGAENQIVNRRPARIGFGDGEVIEIGVESLECSCVILVVRDQTRARGFAVRNEPALATV